MLADCIVKCPGSQERQIGPCYFLYVVELTKLRVHYLVTQPGSGGFPDPHEAALIQALPAPP